jgi:hypothetical protein
MAESVYAAGLAATDAAIPNSNEAAKNAVTPIRIIAAFLLVTMRPFLVDDPAHVAMSMYTQLSSLQARLRTSRSSSSMCGTPQLAGGEVAATRTLLAVGAEAVHEGCFSRSVLVWLLHS